MSTRARRALIGTVALAIAALATAFLSSSPSLAAPQRLLVSNDNVSWSANLATPLFDELGPFVPTDAVPDRFYVKNNSNQPARATFAVFKRQGNLNAFEDNLSFTYTVGDTGSTPVIVKERNKCKSYVTGPTIPAGGTQAVDVTLNFADVSGQTAMNQTADVDMVVTLSQVTPKGMIDICGVQAKASPFTECKSPNVAVVTLVGDARCPVVAGVEAFADGQASGSANRPGMLASTGAPRDATTLLPLGLGLLLAGAGLMVVRRRGETRA